MPEGGRVAWSIKRILSFLGMRLERGWYFFAKESLYCTPLPRQTRELKQDCLYLQNSRL